MIVRNLRLPTLSFLQKSRLVRLFSLFIYLFFIPFCHSFPWFFLPFFCRYRWDLYRSTIDLVSTSQTWLCIEFFFLQRTHRLNCMTNIARRSVLLEWWTLSWKWRRFQQQWRNGGWMYILTIQSIMN